jgi:hypothetical protein
MFVKQILQLLIVFDCVFNNLEHNLVMVYLIFINLQVLEFQSFWFYVIIFLLIQLGQGFAYWLLWIISLLPF